MAAKLRAPGRPSSDHGRILMSVHGPTRCRAPAAYAAAVPRRPPLPDLLLAVALCAVGLVEVLGLPIGEDVVRGSTALNVAAVALTCLPLALRRQAPLTVAGLVVGAIASRALAGPPLELYPTLAAAIVAVYSVAAYASTRDTVSRSGCSGSASPWPPSAARAVPPLRSSSRR
jgi:hypothetical protein